MRALVRATLKACNLHTLGGQDDSMQGICWSDASHSDKCKYNCFCIKDVLLRMNPRIQDARWHCYDSCSNMTGTKNGVAAQIKKLNEKCLQTYCSCNSLILAVGDKIKKIDMTHEITKLMK